MNDFNERDLFAGLAMCGVLANANVKRNATYAEVAEEAYGFADAMLKEKEKRDEAS
jgi:hypothetical protein